jgi:CRISPR-associated protein Cas1
MNSLIIENSDGVIIKGAKIYTKKHTIPVRLIDLLIITQSATILPKDIITISNENIPILYLSKDSKKFALTLPAISKNSELKIVQYKSLEKKVTIAKRLIFEKIVSHKKSLEKFDIFMDETEALTKLSLSKTIDEILGIEGAYAKKYFSYFFTLFERRLTKGFRSKKPPLDPVNALLSYIYTLAYNNITAKLYMRGFDSSISYLHTPFRSHFALSSDILETLRADINLFVVEQFKNKKLQSQDFTNKNGVYLKQKSRIELWKDLKPFLAELNKKLNKQIAKLKKEISMTS